MQKVTDQTGQGARKQAMIDRIVEASKILSHAVYVVEDSLSGQTYEFEAGSKILAAKALYEQEGIVPCTKYPWRVSRKDGKGRQGGPTKITWIPSSQFKERSFVLKYSNGDTRVQTVKIPVTVPPEEVMVWAKKYRFHLPAYRKVVEVS